MQVSVPYDKLSLKIIVPDSAIIFSTSYPGPEADAAQTILNSLRNPIDSPPLKKALERRRKGKVVIVVSDITRPIPYRDFLPEMLAEIESAGVSRDEILILVATGMHRPSSPEEHEYMFGDAANKYQIEDHDPDSLLEKIKGLSLSGREIWLNRSFVNAGFRIITGLVEPHFMAGFSGGRKSVCPGLSSPDTIQSFHGYEFLSNHKTSAGVIEGNPCHEESLSIAKQSGIDFSLNLVLSREKKILRAFAGEFEEAHKMACSFVKKHACPQVEKEADLVITGCGGYPLDATFYQCVKGIYGAVNAVKKNGQIIAAGGCREGMGSNEYFQIMFKYSNDYKGFLSHISTSGRVEKDQWQMQMHTRAIEKTGTGNIVFISSGLNEKERKQTAALSLHCEIEKAEAELQGIVAGYVKEGKIIAVIPEGPYCSPV
jgi:nickel-dependent lactate racemase